MHCKGMLFRQCRVGIANCDDVHWEKVMEGHTCELETYGLSPQADLRAENLRLTNHNGHLGVAFRWAGSWSSTVKSPCRAGSVSIMR